jgi:hypothetical protein
MTRSAESGAGDIGDDIDLSVLLDRCSDHLAGIVRIGDIDA